MTTPLRVVRPIELTDAMLISTDVPEADHAAWSSGTTYSLGQRVIRVSTHRIYESAQNSNLNRTPESSPEWWIEVGPTNRWAMFDTSHSTTTAQSASMSYSIIPGAFNSLGVLSFVGVNSVRVRVTHPTLGTIYDQTINVAFEPESPGWWQWYFGARSAPTIAVLTNLPGVAGTTLVLDFSGTTEMAVGTMVMGLTRDVGIGVLQGVRLGITDYSRKETNDFGDVVLVQRASAKRISMTVPVLAGQVDSTYDYLSGLRAKVSLWIGSTRYGTLTLLGFYKDFDVAIEYDQVAECSLELEGMT